jgi:L-lactate dehydrogenase complex protein LldG
LISRKSNKIQLLLWIENGLPLYCIKKALQVPVEKPYPHEDKDSVYQVSDGNLGILFAKEFIALNGQMFFCSDKEDFVEKLKVLVAEKQWTKVSCQLSLLYDSHLGPLPFIDNTTQEPDAGITDCEFLVARTGTIVMTTEQQCGRAFSVYIPVHIVIAFNHQLVPDIYSVFDNIENNRIPSGLFFISGPSRTGDIEKKLVLGVHGPIEVYVFLLDN